MFLQRLVAVLEAPGVAHVALNALNAIDALNYTGSVADVESYIKKFESWVPLTVPTAELRCSPYQQSPAPIQRVVQPVVDPAVVFVAEPKPEVSQEPSDEIAKASVSHKHPSNPSLAVCTAPAEVNISPISSVEIINVPELHQNQPSVTPVENPKLEVTQLPSEHTVNGPKQCQTLPSAIPTTSSSPTTIATPPSPYQMPMHSVFQPVAVPVMAFAAGFIPEISHAPSVEVFKPSVPHKVPSLARHTAPTEVEDLAISSVKVASVPELHKHQPSVTPVENPKPEAIQRPKQCKSLLDAVPAASSSPTTVPTLLSPCVPVLQHVTPRRSGFQGVASRLFSYETDAKYLKRRAEAKLRRAAAAAKKSSPTWEH